MKKRAFPLRLINLIFLILIGLLCLSLIICSWHLALQFKSYANSSDQYAEVSRAALNIQEGSDYLTEQCRLFVLSTEYYHLENYFFEDKVNLRREKALERIKVFSGNKTSIDFLERALERSKDLEKTEHYVMRLVVEGKHYDQDPSKTLPEEIKAVKLTAEDKALNDDYKISKAWLLLFSQDYLSQKHTISSLRSQAISEIFAYSEDTHEQSFTKLRTVFFQMITSIGAIFFFVLLFFSCVIILVIRPLYKFINNIKSEEKFVSTRTQEINILGDTYNTMYDKNEANEVLLRHKAEHDDLTGLFNRTAYTQVKKALNYNQNSIALILIDVDFFKVINDNHGHSTGDKVLKRVADVLTENFRNTDYICRIGGDEFAVILTGCDENQSVTKELITKKLTSVKEKLKEKIEDCPSISVSCGVAFSENGFDDYIYDKADAALYETKRSGRDGFSFCKEQEISF